VEEERREVHAESAADRSAGAAPPPSPRSRSTSYRIAVAALWIGVQVTLILTADRRPDEAFGFRMFNESSTIRVALYREIDAPGGGRDRVHVDGGVWSARGADGLTHRLTWYDRVPTPYWAFDQEMHASYGAGAELARLSSALEDVASHLAAGDDRETRRLLLEVTIRRNGREPVVRALASRERTLLGGS
jgi:hypothetical protein